MRRSKLAQSEEVERKSNKGKYVKWGLIIFFIVVVIAIIVFIYKFVSESEEKQINKFEKEVKDNQYTELSHDLRSNEQTFSEEDAHALVQYIKDKKGNTQFEKELRQIKRNIKSHNSESSFGSIKDNAGRELVEFSANGKKFFIFSDVKIKPNKVPVYINKNTKEAKYTIGDKRVKKEDNETTKLGDYVAGDYSIKAKQQYSKNGVSGESEGTLSFDTDKLNKRLHKVLATPDFNSTKFNVDIENSNRIEAGTVNLYVNNHKLDYQQGKSYGEYPASANIKVYAKGRYDGKEFKTDEKEVNNDNEQTQQVTLKFDPKEIDKQVRKDKKIKGDAEHFIKSYSKDLNKAYKNSSFSEIERYYGDNKQLTNHMRYMVNQDSKLKYREPGIEEVKKDGNKITVVLSKEDNKNHLIKSQYELNYNPKKEDFKIKQYEDIKKETL